MRIRMAIAMGLLALLLAGIFLIVRGTHTSGPRHPSEAITSPSIAPKTAPNAPTQNSGYRVSGNQVIAPSGRPFVPLGFVVECLAHKFGWQNCQSGGAPDVNGGAAAIRTAATFWHANVLRFQVAQETLFSASPYNTTYLNELDHEVALTNRLGMVAIITLQEEEFHGPPLPTASALRFWSFMAAHFAHHTMVMFDLYNEPRLQPSLGEPWLWNLWQNGGQVTSGKVHETFVGMQQLVDAIRSRGAENVIIAEGNRGDKDLSLLPRHLLQGGNIAYGTEPVLSSRDQTPQEWAANWGVLSAQVPIFMESWESATTAGNCNTQDPILLPNLLEYLQSKHLGLIAYALDGGNLVVKKNLYRPTTFTGVRTYDCRGSRTRISTSVHRHKHRHSSARTAQAPPNKSSVGPGSDIRDFFETYPEYSG